MKYVKFIVVAGLVLVGIHSSIARQMENLGRGVVAVRTGGSSVYLGWRLLGTDPDDTRFNVYRVTGGATNLIASGLANSCNVSDTGAAQASTHTWLVQPVLAGVTQAFSAFTLPGQPPTHQFGLGPLQTAPGGRTADGVPFTYNVNDCSAGDLDGDGEYEIVLKWDPTNSKDNSQSGFTGNVFLDGYKLDGTLLWRIDLGPNIRAGAHYTQFMVYDLDGDGRAEIACKTAPGTKDGLGNYVDGNAGYTTYTNSAGYILSGPEYFTIFDGLTGAALATTNYVPGRGTVSNWGDNYGNRVDRFLAAVAYLDGVRPSVVMCRGYYTRTALCAWDWRDGKLTQRWLFDTGHSGGPWSDYKGQGAHSLTVGDVDGDGKDEIVYGACTIDDDGTGLYNTGLGHGDALHLSDMDPDRPGLEVWMIHESPSVYGLCGLDFHDAKTGESIFCVDGQNTDIGRGVAIDIDPNYRGYEMWGSRGGLMNATGVQLPFNRPGQMNFAIYWNEALTREILDGTTISRYNPANGSVTSLLSPGGISSNNGTKSTPALSADLFGDWREEVIWRNSGNTELRIYTTTTVATNRFYTLMHDPQYRVAIAWQNVAYNQPPHPGFYIGPGMYPPPVSPASNEEQVWRGGGANVWDANLTANWRTNGVWTASNPPALFADGRSVLFDSTGSNNTAVALEGTLSPSRVNVHAAKDFTFAGGGSLNGVMQLIKAGTARLTLDNTNHHTGNTFVRGGALFVNGTLGGSPVIVERRGTPEGPSEFGGAGVLGAGLTVQAGCVLTVGADTNVPGTLTVSNAVALRGARCQFDLSNDPSGINDASDRVVIHGDLILTGTNTIVVRQLNGFLGGGVYPLITYSGSLTGNLANLTLSGGFIQPVALTNAPGMIGLVAIVPDAPPPAPVGLAAGAANAFQINVAWTDNSTNEAAFLVERSTDGVGFTQIASLPTDTTAYQDIGLVGNTTYYYRVRGTNLAGFSDYSNVAQATTSETPAELTWRGDGSGNAWDIAATANWTANGSPTLYADGSFVTFDQSGSNNIPINLSETLQPGSVTVNASKNYTFGGSGSLAGSMGLVKSGSGTLFVSTANSFTGGVTASAGTFTLQNIAAAGGGPIRFNGGTVTFAVGSQQNYSNPLHILANSTLNSAGGNNNIVSGPWSGTNTTLNVVVNGTGTFSVNGNMDNFHGTVSLGSGGGTFRINSGNGNVVFGSSNTLFNLGSNTNKLVNRNGSITVFLGGLSGGGGTTLSGRSSGTGGSGSTYAIGGNNASTTFNGRIINGNDTTAISKVGTGTLTLTGTNTYGGPTTINSGKLLVNGDHSGASGAVTVNLNGTLGGSGIIGSDVTVNGTLAPGTSVGTLTFNQNLTFNPGATALFKISKLPLTNDVARVTGDVAFNGTLNVVQLDPAELLQAGDSFRLFEASGYSNDFAGFVLPGLGEGLDWSTSRVTQDGTLWVISTNPPAINGAQISDGQLSMSGQGGTPGWQYLVLASSNTALPISQWTPVFTNQFDANGNFSVVLPVDPQWSMRFYQLQIP